MLQFVFGLNTLITLLVTLMLVYYVAISFYGLRNPTPPPHMAPKKRFLLMVPAHDEEVVIGALVDNLMELDYPQELYDVYVIADGCKDNTAGIAHERGARVLAHSYQPGEQKGKPVAIAWALQHIDLNQYDGVAFFDADNLAAHNYLRAMNDHLLAGERVIQCYLDTKNPSDNWITMAYAAAFYYVNRAQQVAKQNIGLPDSIGGTGFCVESQLLQELGWHTRTLTEDLEFEMQCLLSGVQVTWCHETKIYDEKPLQFGASGCPALEMVARALAGFLPLFGPLLRRFWRKGDLAALDGALHLLNPALIVISVYVGLIACIQGLLNLLGYTVLLSSQVLPVFAGYAFLVYQLTYVAICIKKDTKLRSWSAIVPMFAFNITYMPLTVWALFTNTNGNWNRTEHVRSLQVKEISQLGS